MIACIGVKDIEAAERMNREHNLYFRLMTTYAKNFDDPAELAALFINPQSDSDDTIELFCDYARYLIKLRNNNVVK